MKKLLPIIACALLASGNMAKAIAPEEMAGLRICAVSANGNWAVSCDENEGIFIVVNLETSEDYWYGTGSEDETIYSAGLGKCVSDNGIVVAAGYETELPYYWENGQWNPLPIKETDYAAYPQAITPDGSRIVGNVSKAPMSVNANEVMVVPAVWNRNDEGSYDLYVEVAHPVADWTGRLPQYVLVDDVSADGKVLAGDLVDYSGFTQQPIVFTEGNDGSWSYTMVHPELINPEGIEFPYYPGEAPEEPNPVDYMAPDKAEAYLAAKEAYDWRPMPDQFDFMTDDEYVAYEEALNAYYEDWENNPYPSINYFMTDEELNAYYAALNEYYDTPAPDINDYMTAAEHLRYEAAEEAWEKAFAKWQVEYALFDEAYWSAVVNPDALTFTMNSAHISPNGRYYLIGSEAYILDPTNPMGFAYASTPVLFDLEGNAYTVLADGVKDILAQQVFDNGAVLGGTPSDNYTRNAVISKSAGEPFVFIADLIKDADTQTYAWMEENMVHNVKSYDYVYNEETGEYDEVVTETETMLTGTPIATNDLKTIVTWIYNTWDLAAPTYFSYVLPLNVELDGVSPINLSTANCLISLDNNGILSISGNAAKVAIYDVNGRQVYNSNAPAAKAKTGLQGGVYIVKATTADGRTIVKKAAI